jgi:diguanylate cyclase (GGDEF)-like protein
VSAERLSVPADARSDRGASMPSIAPRPSLIDFDWINEDTSVSRETETNIAVPPSMRDRNRASLIIMTGLNAGQVFSLEGRESIIGRSRDCHVRIEDVGISRQHTRVVRTLEGKYLAEDLSSTNGTFIGGRRIDRAEIASGDLLQVGPNVVLRFALIDEHEEKLARQLFESSTRDPLTRAYNRKYLLERLQSEVAYAHRHRTRLGTILFDLDHFKKVNDTYGHLAGDEVLRSVSTLVTRLIRVEDVFARFGGEEFVILVRGIEPANLALFAERVRRSVEKTPVAWDDQVLRQTISAGVASLVECGENATGEELLRIADERLYRAKSSGRNRICRE